MTLAAFACGILMSASAQSTEINELNPGDKAPLSDMKMTNIDGQQWSLVDIAGENGTLVIFSCNTCPFVVGREGRTEGWEGRYNEVAGFARENGIGSVLVNSNEAKRKGRHTGKFVQNMYVFGSTGCPLSGQPFLQKEC